MIIKDLKNKINFSALFKITAVLFLAFFVTSCSKKVEVKGKLTNSNPLERIEFIESSGVATLPLVNLGLDKNGNFEGSFDAPKSGMYVITFAGKQGMIYLKGGEKVNITGDAAQFPTEYAVTGDAKNNNDFIKNSQLFLDSYAAKLSMQEIIMKGEPAFLSEAKRINEELSKNIDENAKKYDADKEAVQWKKDELTTSILGLLSQYKVNHGQTIQNPSFKVSKNLLDYENTLKENNDRLVENHPQYRNYLLSTMTEEFQKYSAAHNTTGQLSPSQIFADLLKTKKDMSQTTKDYLLAYVIAQSDLTMNSTKESTAKVNKIIDSEIKNEAVKKDLKQIEFVISGLKEGDALPKSDLVKADGSKYSLSDLKGKPTLVMFYASWNPRIATSTLPVLNEVVNFYKSKIDFAYINLDDSKEQFQKSSSAMLKGLPGVNAYAEGGLNSEFAKNFGLYGFKLPGFLVLDKDGKIAGHYFVNLGDPEIVTILTKVSGLKAPEMAPQMPQMMPGMQQNAQPQQAPQSQPQPTK
ncbi:TlpA family protein disulfide reductase [Halpernia frigidisoli]|uniref:Thiol-disulfide isomerase or thioredoxin n=1 Tax=Halpernia frigidisoli TaxID=1125876 RepID=A0A1I3GQR8_9FLAO|nr:TlpA disulfide reductase family protein [Halpernia frigidisoli]SFI25734.1 Thiol-disulfide isomerase or thioredoxin [Halpernia frigidisoli]